MPVVAWSGRATVPTAEPMKMMRHPGIATLEWDMQDAALIATQSFYRLEMGGETMASITIRKLDDDVKSRLRVRAASNGRSMEEEARLILAEAVGRESEPENLASFIHELFKPYGGVELELPPREPMREPPDFS